MKAVLYLASSLLRPLNAAGYVPRFGVLRRYTILDKRIFGRNKSVTPSSTLYRFPSTQPIQALSMTTRSAWPSHRVVHVDSRATEVYHMSSSDGGLGFG